MDVFAAIADQARFLAYAYPTAAEDYRKRCEVLQWTRDYSPNDTPSEWQNVLKLDANCGEYRKRLVDLVRLIRVHLPDVYPRLRVVPEVGPWHSIQDFDWGAAIGELRTIEAAAAVRAAADGTTPTADQDQAVGTIPAEPKVYLTSWTEILSFLEMIPDKKRWLVKANERYDGPIIPGEQGEQPFCECGELRRWYGSLAERLRQIQQHKRDRQATVADKYKYGRDGTVVPEISGAVKKRRRDAKR